MEKQLQTLWMVAVESWSCGSHLEPEVKHDGARQEQINPQQISVALE